MRLLRKMLMLPAPKPTQQVVTAGERAETEAAKQRLAGKWARFDRLVEDFEKADIQLRVQRR